MSGGTFTDLGTLIGQHTPGPWRPGKHPFTVVADVPISDGPRGCDDTSYYGGHLIAESIAACNVPAITAVPHLLQTLHDTVAVLRAAIPGIPMDVRYVAVARADAADRLISKVLRGEYP